MSAPDFEPFDIDIDAMSAVLAKMTGIKTFFDDVMLVNLFGCKKELFIEYCQRLGLKSDKDDFSSFRDEILGYVREELEKNKQTAPDETERTGEENNNDDN